MGKLESATYLLTNLCKRVGRGGAAETGETNMRYKSGIATALCAAALLASTPASATIINFTVTGDDTASWSIDDTVAPSFVDADTFVYSADMTVNGTPTGIVGITFYDDAFSGGIYGGGFGFLSPQLFSRPTSSPTFLLGTFNAIGFPDDSRSYTVTISAEGGVPEPSTWAMMLVGFGGIGYSMRARRRKMLPQAA
jgi:hypothetical protein